MAASTGSKCPICKRTVAVGFVSGTLVQHEDKTGFRCPGTGATPVTAVRATAQPRTTAAGTGPARVPGAPAAAKATPAAKAPVRGVKVTQSDVDPEELVRRQEARAAELAEKSEAARERNGGDANVSYFNEKPKD
jgi:hypothetical protein